MEIREVVESIECRKLKMHHVPRRKTCSLPINHEGPVPNVPVGTSWKYRLQVSARCDCIVCDKVIAEVFSLYLYL